MKPGKRIPAILTLITLAALAIAVFFSLPHFVKFTAEKRISAATGMQASIGSISMDPSTASIHVQDLRLQNDPSFGGNTFVEMPDLFLQYDQSALLTGRLLLKSVRIQISKIEIVENVDGGFNLAALQQRKTEFIQEPMPRSATSNAAPMEFDGIELLNLSLGRVQFTSQRDPTLNWMGDLNIKEETFRNLKTELDFQTAALVLVLKAGLSGSLDFDAIFRAGSRVAKNPRPISPDTAAPVLSESGHSRSAKE